MLDTKIRILLVALATSFTVTAAQADEFSYSLGRKLGEQTAFSAWRNLRVGRSCRGIDQLQSAVKRSIRRIGRSASRFERRDKVDYARGYVRGLWDVFLEVAEQCPSRCSSVRELASSADRLVHEEVSRLVGVVPRSVWRQELPRGFCSSR